ncbi:hypothetical protein LSAT2_002967 [Lamellibrachia satsuma]|nr:hypothetical protein LSAT2_002967 [Lamellibrachia satsuma]
MVAMHLRTLCENETRGNNAVKQNVFKVIYSHLQTHGLKDPDVHDVLSNTPCVLVEDGNGVFANQTVINMYDTDEIRPYLYKLPLYLDAIDRLARHEAHCRGIEPDTARIADATNRLSRINVHGVVGNIVTELVYGDKPVVGSELKKTCFVEKPHQPGRVKKWHVYVSSDADLSLDLLVPFAGVINEIMSGLLRDAILYLQPIISCQSEDDINTTLNNLNVHEHHATAERERTRLVPRPGDQIPETHIPWLKTGGRAFDVGEFVGYKEDDSHPVLYGIIKDHQLSTPESGTYFVTIGESLDVIADDAQLYKFV